MTEGKASKERIIFKGRKNIPRSDMKDVGRRICAVRNNYTLTQQQMADKLLVSRNYLSEIENGRRVVPGPMLVALEAVFLVSREWIINGTGEMLLSDTPGARKKNNEHEDIVELLKGFRSMSDDGRKKLMNILKVFILVDTSEGGNS